MNDEFSLFETATALGDLFLPRVCAVCGRPLAVRERHLCIRCAADLPLTRYWERSHNPMADRFNALLQRQLFPPEASGTAFLATPSAPYGDAEAPSLEVEGPLSCEVSDSLSRGAAETPSLEVADSLSGEPAVSSSHRPAEPYAYAASLLLYHSEALYKRIPQRIKYSSDLRAGAFFGRMLGECLSDSGPLHDVETVVPVPLHWMRRWQRGYNQAEVIAKAVAEPLGAILRTDILVRERRTRTQTRLGTEAKLENVAGAFRIRKGALPSLQNEIFRHILLVDDVFTTGATLAACYHALRSAIPPPVRISIATLACVDG